MAMTMTAFVETEVKVDCVQLADGKIVRLTGVLGPEDVVDVRDVLLMPLEHGVTDVVVDAGRVTSISDEVVAVLIAAPVWIETQGGRFLLSASSPSFDRTLEELDFVDLLPRLGASAPRTRVPGPRQPKD
jgi:anti-anti-sigma regulatory factor